MLGLGRYALGVAELGLIVGFAWLGAGAVRRRVAGGLDGAAGFLATLVLAIALLLWVAELLGSFGWFKAGPYLAVVIVAGVGLWAVGRESPSEADARSKTRAGQETGISVADLIAFAVAVVAVIHFAGGVRLRLSTGMTGFDSTWYHGPFATGFFQSGDTWSLHYIAPQFLAWFYPANSEVVHAIGMAAFGRDIASPLLNLGWFVGCLVAGWCIGRPYKVSALSLALTAIALSVPALSDQAGEARNDIVGIFFLLAAVAIALNAWAAREGDSRLPLGPLFLVGLAAGLAAGTKLNFLLPAGVLVLGLIVVAPRGDRGRAFAVAGLAALAGGGYWYLRDLAHAGNPLPWVKHLGPITLPAPDQALGGREGHSVLTYLTDGSVWSDWFLPGLHHGLTVLWPLLGALALAGLLLSLGRGADPVQRLAGLVGLAAGFAWLVAPTSASGPDGMPQGFESGLRYLAPALTLGLVLLPTAPQLRQALASLLTSSLRAHTDPERRSQRRGWGVAGVVVGVLALVAVGYPVQRHYLERRYADPSFSASGLDAAFKWAQGVTDARIATTSTRQYPLFGRDLSNRVSYLGEERSHGGFAAPTTCRRWRELLNTGHYDYVVTTRDRIEPGKPPYPPAARWTEAPNATVVLRKPPTVIYKLRGNLDPSACR
jgi:hypothetical protein